MKLNLGCGDNKIPGYINIDGERKVKPDVVLDFRLKPLPYKDNSAEEVLLFHCIEHIQKLLHHKVLLEVQRVLKPDGLFYISYPDFWECAQRWKNNTGGQRRFWEATLYGRQLYKGDYHVCAMDRDELTALLYECGFKNVMNFPEPGQEFNTVTIAMKDKKGPVPTYETIAGQDTKNMVVKELKK